MKNSIEAIWKEGFLNESSLVAPKINDLYNQKSRHLVGRMERMFRLNLTIIVSTAIIFPVVYYFLDAAWEGAAASLLLLLTAWYNKRQIDSIKALDHTATSLDYLKSLRRWLGEVVLKSEKVARYSYPVYVLIALSTVWSAWTQQGLAMKIQQKFPNLPFVGYLPLIALLTGVVIITLMLCFSARIYRWEVRLMYGRVFDKLEATIDEMEKLKQGL